MNRVIAYTLLFLLMILPATASEIAKCYTTVINEPPEVIDIKISEPVEGRPLICEATIKDEIKDVKIRYKWYKNNVLIEGQEEYFLNQQFFEEGDMITCEVVPNDFVQDGEPKQASAVIQPGPVPPVTGEVTGVGEGGSFVKRFFSWLFNLF